MPLWTSLLPTITVRCAEFTALGKHRQVRGDGIVGHLLGSKHMNYAKGVAHGVWHLQHMYTHLRSYGVTLAVLEVGL